nr:MAG TPA: hypothetical protein [Bacteriophage sp.]
MILLVILSSTFNSSNFLSNSNIDLLIYSIELLIVVISSVFYRIEVCNPVIFY